MSVRHALLAILTEGTCYGYQLRTEYTARTGTAAPLNVGQIYNTLDRLERDGLVVKGTTDEAGHVPYTITDEGRADVGAWLDETIGPPATRDELLVKVALALSLPGADAGALVRAQRERSLADARELALSREAHDTDVPLAVSLAADAVEAALTARLAWLDAAERRILDAGAAGTRPTGFAAAPRRGRPARRDAQP